MCHSLCVGVRGRERAEMINRPIRKYGAPINEPAFDRAENPRIVGADAMITHARPIAIRRSRVQTRISLRRECGGAGRPAALASERSLLALAVIWLAVTREDDAGAGISGDVEVAGCFSSSLSILGALYL